LALLASSVGKGEHQVYTGVAGVEGAKRPGQVHPTGYFGGAQDDPATQHGSQVCQVGARRRQLVEDALGTDQKQLSSGRELDSAGGPGEQADVELGLELAYLCGDSRLSDTQPPGRPGEAAAAHHGREVHHLPQLHTLIMENDNSWCKPILDL
jgi:hypothetical protein